MILAALSAYGFDNLVAADSSHPLFLEAFKRILLTVGLGDMGLSSAVSSADAAFLGSAALTRELVRDLGDDLSTLQMRLLILPM